MIIIQCLSLVTHEGRMKVKQNSSNHQINKQGVN